MNLWQYAVLLEGLGAIGTAAAVAKEALRRDPLNLLGYTHVGVLLIALSACASIGANIRASPNLATWIAAVGFAMYGVATIAAWTGGARLARLREFFRTHDHGGGRTSRT